MVEDGPRRRPQTLGGAVYLVVVATAMVGLGIAATGSWRSGLVWMGSALVGGGIARLVLPERQAGMLQVRRKPADVAMLVLAGAGLIVLAIVVPDQPR